MIKKELNPEHGNRLKECLEDARMTQKELAEKSGYTKQYISNIVVGKKNMSHESAAIFSKILHVQKEYLLCESDFKTEDDFFEEIMDFGDFKNNVALALLEVFDIKFVSTILETDIEGVVTEDGPRVLIFDKEFLLNRKVNMDGVGEERKIEFLTGKVNGTTSDIKARVEVDNIRKDIPFDTLHYLYRDIFDYAKFKCDKFKKEFSSL